MGPVPPWPWPDIPRIREGEARSAATDAAAAEALAEIRRHLGGDPWVAKYLVDHRDRLVRDVHHVAGLAGEGGPVVDVGAAPFVLSRALRRLGREVVALDLDPGRFPGLGALGLDVRRCDVERQAWPVAPGSARVVVMFEIFEHLRVDLLATVAEARRVVAPDGRVVVSTPNLRSAAGLLHFVYAGRAYSCCGDLHEEWGKIGRLGHMGHVREYTAWELVPFFARCGLHTERIVFRGRFADPALQALVEEQPALAPFMMFVLRPG